MRSESAKIFQAQINQPSLGRAGTFLLAVQNEPPVVTAVQFFAESLVRERFFSVCCVFLWVLILEPSL
jgi:hypothetical protein